MHEWWKKSCVYQIYPASFNDTTGTGTGDLAGITEKLDYLKTLGIDIIWLSPVYASPMVDNGYDISDYYSINPLFGTMADMEHLIRSAKSKGIHIIMDLVVNHTSDQHPWFQESIQNPDGPYGAYYIWHKNKGQLPNDLNSVFGGPAWSLNETSNRYYFHQFAPEQPDLNWSNPNLRKEIYKMMNWWLDKGIAGFRMDVIDLIGKIPDEKITINGPRLHDYIKEMHAATYGKRQALTVGECWGADIPRAVQFSNPENHELSMVFQFHHIMIRWNQENKWIEKAFDLSELKNIITQWQIGLYNNGWNALFLGNHDLPRTVSFWGNDSIYRVESAKMLATFLHGLQGTPYIYQGDELGMTNVNFTNIEDYDDIECLNYYKSAVCAGENEDLVLERIQKIGRDNARTPMQWDDSAHGGFTSGTPWLKVNSNHSTINAQSALNDKNSIFYHYQALIQLRKDMPIFSNGQYQLLRPEHKEVFAYKRFTDSETLVCVNNFTDQTLHFDLNDEVGRILSHNYDKILIRDTILSLRPYESILFYYDKAI